MLNELKNIIKGEVVSESKELSSYSHDASIFEVKPELVARPKDSEDIKNLVKYISENKSSNPKLSLTARAGGSDMSGGPLNESIILDFTAHMNNVLEVGNDYSTTQSGAFYRDFEKETLKKGLLLPSYPASRELCAVGGMVANNAGGEKSLRHGKTANFVEELNVVLGDGNEYILKSLIFDELEQKKAQTDFEGDIYRKMHELLETNYDIIQKARPDVSKNSAGYALWDVYDKNSGKFDLTQLFTGSQGTLGIITKIKFKLIKPAKHSKLLVIFIKDMNKVGDLVVELNKYNPESMESYDDNTIKLSFKIFPELIKKIGLGAVFRFVPDVWAMIAGGMPKLVILTELVGDDEKDLKNKVKKIKDEIEKEFSVRTRIASSKADVQKYWTIRRESFNLLRNHVKGKKTVPFIDDIIVKPEYLPRFLPELNKILDNYKEYMFYTVAGHPGNGNFHIIPLMDLSDERTRKIIPEVSDKVYDLVIKFGGSITAEHNDGLIRTPYLEKMYGEEVYGLFRKVKEIFDPQNIFNPGKKVGVNMGYVVEHIKRE